VQLRKQAKVAGRLGKAIDNFRSTAKDRSLINDKVELMLARIEPFPKTISVKDVKTEGDKAAALIVSETTSRFVPRAGLPVALKKTDGIWRIDLPLTGNAREILDYLERNGQDVVNALDTVKKDMKTEATTKENVASALREELNKVDPNLVQGIH